MDESPAEPAIPWWNIGGFLLLVVAAILLAWAAFMVPSDPNRPLVQQSVEELRRGMAESEERLQRTIRGESAAAIEADLRARRQAEDQLRAERRGMIWMAGLALGVMAILCFGFGVIGRRREG